MRDGFVEIFQKVRETHLFIFIFLIYSVVNLASLGEKKNLVCYSGMDTTLSDPSLECFLIIVRW